MRMTIGVRMTIWIRMIWMRMMAQRRMATLISAGKEHGKGW